MAIDPAQLPKDIAALTALLIAAEARAEKAEARTLNLDAQIAHLKLTIAKMRRDTFGASSEKGARLLDQLEMQLGELVASVAEGKVERTLATSVADALKRARNPPVERSMPSCRASGSCMPRPVLVRTAAVNGC